MSLGRGQDLQAGTSETQGRVYAMVLQAELVDQFDAQGTFLFSYVLTRVLFNSDASYPYLLLHHA